MSKVEFNEDKYASPSYITDKNVSGMKGLIIKSGLAKNENMAAKILFLFFLIIAIAAIFISTGSGTNYQQTTTEDARYRPAE